MLERSPPDVSDRPFALPNRELITTVVDLPPPPSVNETRKINWHAAKKLERWKKSADKLVLAAKSRSVNPLGLKKVPGRFELRVVVSEHHTNMDLDNALKNIIDFLCRIELITDDGPKYMRRLIVEWGLAPEGCRVTITELA